MAYLDNHGLETLWTKIKATFAKKVGNTTGDSSVTIKLQNASGSDISGGSTEIAAATTSAAGVMSKADKSKLDGIEAEANKYVHPTTAGNKHIPAGGASGQILGYDSDGTAKWMDAPDTGVTKIVAGSNVQVSPTGGTGQVTVSATDTTYESKEAASGGTDVSLVTTGEKYTWNQSDVFVATYNVTTFADLKAAVDAHKAIVLVYASALLAVTTSMAGSAAVALRGIYTDPESGFISSVNIIVNSSDIWTEDNWGTIELKDDKVTSWSATVSDANYPSEKLVKNSLDAKQDALSTAQLNAANSGITAAKVSTYDGYSTGKQDTLVSGTNIKTVNNVSLLGSGNIDTDEVFVATYGTTGYSALSQALDDEKIIYISLTDELDPYDGMYVCDLAYVSNTGNIVLGITADAIMIHLMLSASSAWSYDIVALETEQTRVTSWSSTPSDDNHPSEKLVKDSLDAKQDTISDLATIRSGAALGATSLQDDDVIEADTIDVDSTPTTSSTNLVTSGGVKSYVDAAITSGTTYQGTLATEAALTALTNYKQGQYWIASASWTSASLGVTIDTGNLIIAKTAASTYAAANFNVIQSDIEAIPDSVINALS